MPYSALVWKENLYTIFLYVPLEDLIESSSLYPFLRKKNTPEKSYIQEFHVNSFTQIHVNMGFSDSRRRFINLGEHPGL